jgi:hypothetical protein
VDVSALAEGATQKSTLTVTNGSSKLDYVITIAKKKAAVVVSGKHDTTLSKITVLGGDFSPMNVGAGLIYTDSVAIGATKATVSAVVTDAANATVNVNGSTLASTEVTLGATDPTVVTIKVTNGTSSLSYTLNIVHKKSVTPAAHDTTLTTLTYTGTLIHTGTLIPGFSSKVTSYTDSVDSKATSETFVATATDAANAKVTGTLVVDVSSLAEGASVMDTLTVTNGSSKLQYVIKIVKKKAAVVVSVAHDTTLTGILPGTGKLLTKFAPSTTTYTDSVNVGTTSEVFHVTRKDPKATVTFNGKADSTITLSKDTTPVAIVVNNGTSTLTYTVTIVRKLPEIAVTPRDSVLKTNFTFDLSKTMTDSAQIRSHYGYFVTHGAASTAKVTVASGVLTFNWNLVYNAADGDYGTAAAIHLPLDSLLRTYDLSKVTAITFNIMSSAPMTMNVLLDDDSTAYSTGAVSTNAKLQSSDISLTRTETSVTVLVSDLSMPSWLVSKPACVADQDCGKETFYSTTPDSISIAPHVKALVFQPIIGWKSKSAIATNATGNFSIRDIVLTVKQ